MNSIRKTVRQFLELLEGPGGSAEENESALVLLLDQLALATHQNTPSAPQTEIDAPRREYGEVRALVVERFPRYGVYRAASTEPEDEFLVGDAIDDIADIALDLAEVEWLWKHSGKTDALWQFQFDFKHHWGAHLRSLQWYVHELREFEP